MYKKLFSQINDIKLYFQSQLSQELNLLLVPAPLFIDSKQSLNDMLSGNEPPVDFEIYSLNKNVEIVQSLAKWKRVALKKYDFQEYEGIVTNMIAIRRNETTDNTHSILVDQWDWEVIIPEKDRTIFTLSNFVKKIYKCIYKTQTYINEKYKLNNNNFLPSEIFIIHSQELENMYPNLTPKEREDAITKMHKAVFIISIGKILNSGEAHDTRSAEYDDWNLNGDILVWSASLNKSIELSSMGIRVDSNSLQDQLKQKNMRIGTQYHNAILNNQIPFTIGGGIGQSRLAMFILNKKHIGEVQVSEWSENELKEYKKIL